MLSAGGSPGDRTRDTLIKSHSEVGTNTSQDSISVPACQYCDQSLVACNEMRDTRPDVFEALHYDSPEMVEKRRKYATAVMIKQIGTPLPDWYR